MSSLTDALPKSIKKPPLSAYLIGGTVLAAVVLIGISFVYSKNQPKQDTALNAGLPRTLPSSWLIKYFGHDDEYDVSIGGPTGDPDGDILTNIQEFYFNTDPTNPDTDGDGQFDGAEVVVNSNPSGGGKLYSDEYARNFAKEYIEKNNITEFKEDNIRAAVLGLLNPPDELEVIVPLPDAKDFAVSKDDSAAAVENYMEKSKAAVADLALPDGNLQNLARGADTGEAASAAASIYQAIDRLRLVEVPEPFLNLHRLQIAGLFSSAAALEKAVKIDGNKTLESQADQTRELYYQLAVIEKVNKLSADYIITLSEKYSDAFN